MQRKVEFYFDYKSNYLYDAAPMQKVKIPITLDPVRAAQRGLSYEGVVPFDTLTRLGEVVTAGDSEVQVNVHCKKDKQGNNVIAGNASTKVVLQCQRCNEDLGLDLELEFAYSPVGIGKSSEHLPEYYEIAEMDEDGEINLHRLIEDELMLAIPIIPAHEDSNCQYSEQPLSFGEIEAKDDKPNPFDILKQLKKDS